VVTCTIPLFGCVECMLFDLSATHSFISSSYVKLCKLSTKPLEQNICIATPVGDAITSRKCVDNCPIEIEGRILPMKLEVFGMLGFDVILGMDWLLKYKANIDCHRKEVTFRPHGMKEFRFCGSNVRAILPLLSTIDLMPGTQPIHKAPYHMALTELRELKEQLQELLDQGFILPSVSLWVALELFVKKKDGSMRMCIDYLRVEHGGY
jgi:hypothetical protein